MLALLIACTREHHEAAGTDSPVFPELPGPDVDPPLPHQVSLSAADSAWSDAAGERAAWDLRVVQGPGYGTLLGFKTSLLGVDDGMEVRLSAAGASGWEVEAPQATLTTDADFVWSNWDEVASVGGPNPGLLVGARGNSLLADSAGTVFFVPADTTGTHDLETWSWRWDGTNLLEQFGATLGWVGDPVGEGRSYFAAYAMLETGCGMGCLTSAVLLPIDEPGLDPASAPVRIDPVAYPEAESFAAGAFAGADLNGDGVGDLVLGNRSGRVGDEGSGWVATFEGPIPLGTWRPSDYTRRWHRTDYYAWFGDKVVNAGDVTGDGLDDLVATSWDWASAGAGAEMYGLPKHAYLIPGGAESGEVSYAAVAEFVEAETGRVQETRLELAVPGDVDGDSVPDILLGSSDLSGPDPEDRDDRGSVWLFSGTSRGTTEMTWYANATVFTGSPGQSLRYVTGGDLDGDALADLVLGAYGYADDGSVSTLYTFLAPI